MADDVSGRDEENVRLRLYKHLRDEIDGQLVVYHARLVTWVKLIGVALLPLGGLIAWFGIEKSKDIDQIYADKAEAYLKNQPETKLADELRSRAERATLEELVAVAARTRGMRASPNPLLNWPDFHLDEHEVTILRAVFQRTRADDTRAAEGALYVLETLSASDWDDLGPRINELLDDVTAMGERLVDDHQDSSKRKMAQSPLIAEILTLLASHGYSVSMDAALAGVAEDDEYAEIARIAAIDCVVASPSGDVARPMLRLAKRELASTHPNVLVLGAALGALFVTDPTSNEVQAFFAKPPDGLTQTDVAYVALEVLSRGMSSPLRGEGNRRGDLPNRARDLLAALDVREVHTRVDAGRRYELFSTRNQDSTRPMPRNSYMLPLDTTLQSHIEAGDLAGAFRLAELFSVRSTSSHEPSAGPPGERFAGLFCAHLPDDGGPLLLADGDEVRPEQISRRRVLLEPVPDGEGRGRLRVWWMAEYRDGVPPSVHDGHLKSAPSRVTSITFEAPEDILR